MPKMYIDSNGLLQCPSDSHRITHNSPFPTKNGTPGGFSEPANGYVLHTEVGYEHSVVDEFNNPNIQASAFFSIGMDGHIHQYGPVGKGWKAWTQAGGNTKYRGVEHEDHGNPKNPFSAEQLESTASVLEAVSKHDGFPLVACDNPTGKGVLFHSDGGAAWGGHDCPGTVRRGQRDAILKRAKQIRASRTAPAPVVLPPSPTKALQAALHVAVDGDWGKATEAAVQAVKKNKHGKDEQAAVGAKVDGIWGPQSQKAYVITLHRVQKALGVKETGTWNLRTTLALRKARKNAHR
jgi:hypothetical protein